MRSLKVILLFTVVYFTTVQSQTVKVTFFVKEQNVPLSPIWVGLDSTATNGLDPHLGEMRLPFWEGWGAAFDITQYTGTSTLVEKDYRNAPSFPFTGTVEHRLGWQFTYLGNNTFTIYYNLPAGITVNFKDYLGGVFYNETFTDSGSFSVPGSWGQWAILTMYYDNVLPVELLSFTASVLQNKDAIKLEWTTLTEKNNHGFEIERLKDFKIEKSYEWEKLGFVEGHGTTTEQKSYSFIDEDVSTGIYKYRLKQIDFDGSYEYSNEIEVNADVTPKEFVLHQNYPNPFNPTTKIIFTIPTSPQSPPLQGGEAKQGWFTILKVYDILGNEVATLVNENKPAGSYEVNFDASELSSGVYFYQLKTGNYIGTKKLTILK